MISILHLTILTILQISKILFCILILHFVWTRFIWSQDIHDINIQLTILFILNILKILFCIFILHLSWTRFVRSQDIHDIYIALNHLVHLKHLKNPVPHFTSSWSMSQIIHNINIAHYILTILNILKILFCIFTEFYDNQDLFCFKLLLNTLWYCNLSAPKLISKPSAIL